jgi:formyltetrahydrofolate hydrolase
VPGNKAAQAEILNIIDGEAIPVWLFLLAICKCCHRNSARLRGVINIHHSFLPSFKGARPITRRARREADRRDGTFL